MEKNKWLDHVRDSNLKPTTKLVLLVISTYMDKKSVCHPSITTIANKCCMKKNAIYTNLKLAEKAGYIVRKKTRYDNLTYMTFTKYYGVCDGQ